MRRLKVVHTHTLIRLNSTPRAALCEPAVMRCSLTLWSAGWRPSLRKINTAQTNTTLFESACQPANPPLRSTGSTFWAAIVASMRPPQSKLTNWPRAKNFFYNDRSPFVCKFRERGAWQALILFHLETGVFEVALEKPALSQHPDLL